MKPWESFEDWRRFMSRVRRTDGCWYWTGPIRGVGYGAFRFDGRDEYAHRWIWENTRHREVPDGLHIDHKCRTRNCVRPSHLRPLTPYENWRIGESPAAQNLRKTACRRGHPYSHQDRWGRRCRTCNTMLARLSRQRRQGHE